MGIKVTSIYSTAGGEAPQPREGVLVILPKADIRPELIPVAALSYAYLTSSAALDSSGKYQFFLDAPAVVDAASRQTAKLVSSTFSVPDYSRISYGKSVADAFTLSDLVTRVLAYSRTFQSSTTTTDRAVFAVGRSEFDSILTSDVMRRSVGKRASDLFTLTSKATIDSSKPLSITFSATDRLLSSVSKQESDQASVDDQVARATSKALADALSFAHFISTSVGRVILDGVAMNDSADLADGVAMQSVKGVSNVAFATDFSSLSVASLQSDVAAIASAGSLVSQGYCDPIYFAEDYVGLSRTFT